MVEEAPNTSPDARPAQASPAQTLPIGPPPLPAIPVAVAAATSVRFCGKCGGAWQPEWAECVTCRPSATGADAESATVRVERQLSELKSAFLLYGLMLGTIVLFMLASLSAKGRTLPLEAEFVEQAVLAAVTVAWVAMYRREVWGALARRVHPLWFLAAVAISGASFGVANAAMWVLRKAGVPEVTYSAPFVEGGYGLATFVVSLAVMPAIFEELAFRGVMLPAMERVMGSREALVVVSMMFAILHLSVPSIPHLLVLGLALGALRQRTGSLLPGMLVHFCHNLWVGLSEWKF